MNIDFEKYGKICEQVAQIIKKKFNNLSVDETLKLTNEIVGIVIKELM